MDFLKVVGIQFTVISDEELLIDSAWNSIPPSNASPPIAMGGLLVTDN
jgi:hypothetical protein